MICPIRVASRNAAFQLIQGVEPMTEFTRELSPSEASQWLQGLQTFGNGS